MFVGFRCSSSCLSLVVATDPAKPTPAKAPRKSGDWEIMAQMANYLPSKTEYAAGRPQRKFKPRSTQKERKNERKKERRKERKKRRRRR